MSDIEFKTRLERRFYRELLKYGRSGATLYELRMGVDPSLLPGTVRNQVRNLVTRGHIKVLDACCSDPDRKSRNSEPCDLYAARACLGSAACAS